MEISKNWPPLATVLRTFVYSIGLARIISVEKDPQDSDPIRRDVERELTPLPTSNQIIAWSRVCVHRVVIQKGTSVPWKIMRVYEGIASKCPVMDRYILFHEVLRIGTRFFA